VPVCRVACQSITRVCFACQFIQFLLDKGADKLITDNNGAQTAYDLAKKKNHKAAAALLRPQGQNACCVIL